MEEVALIIIYNHQYNKNIEIVEAMYAGRFSNIFHLVPFYSGEKENVIPVYENSFYFQGYIAQGLKSFFKNKFKHYFFIADDLVVNPLINEHTYEHYFKLSKSSCFIPSLISLHDVALYWNWMGDAYNLELEGKGVEAKKQLPAYEDAVALFSNHGLQVKPLKQSQIFLRKSFKHIRNFHDFIEYLKDKIKKKKSAGFTLRYPLVRSYSDIFIVSSDAIKAFCHYCGVFASTSLFVELGLPTALVLSAKHIVQEKDLALEGMCFWNEEDWQIVEKYRSNLQSLLSDFPDKLYLHPIKFSQWIK